MPNYTAKSILEREELDIFRQQRRDPFVLSGMFLELTRNLYLHPSHLYPTVRTWSENNSPEHTYVEASHVWTDEDVNRRPAIIIDIGDLMYSTQRVQGLGDKSGMNLKEGIYYYARKVNGSVVWQHLGRSRGHALQYGCNTLDLVDAFSDIIQRDFCFEKFEVRGILKPRQRKDQPLDFECRVQADFQFQENFQIKLESPKLKTISTDKQVNLNC